MDLITETFFAILRGWPERFRNGNATTEDFIAFAEEISGEELEGFFNGWLFQPGLPSLTPEHHESEPVATPLAS